MDSKEPTYAAEKYSNESPPMGDPSRVVEEKGIRIGEAADMYGDLASAEEYGYVSRG
jgi:amino acid transporter